MANYDLSHLPYTTLFRSGDDDLVQKPQYFSVMNYSYQTGIGVAPAVPFATTAVDPSTSHRIDYSNQVLDRKSTRLNSSHQIISYAVFCLKKKNKYNTTIS